MGNYQKVISKFNDVHLFRVFQFDLYYRELCPLVTDIYLESALIIALSYLKAGMYSHKGLVNRRFGWLKKKCSDVSPIKYEISAFQALYFEKTGEFQKAHSLLERINKNIQNVYEEDHHKRVYLLCRLGSIYLRLKNFEKAKNIFSKVIGKVQDAACDVFEVLIGIGKFYQSIKQYKTAHSYFVKALHLSLIHI